MSCLNCCKTAEVESPSYREALAESAKRRMSRGYITFKSLAAAVSLKTGSSKHRQINEQIKKYGEVKNDIKVFTYNQIAEATENFNSDNLLGEGGFGSVYKGYICDQHVAMKQLNRQGAQGTREFYAEVLMLSLVKHPNLVQLVGYCTEDEHRVLVYEYMAKGSLENHLLGMYGAQPLLKDKKQFSLIADPLLNGQFPAKGLFQALAVAAMCLQEDPEKRPDMDDVVTALAILSATKTDEKDGAGEAVKTGGHVESFRAAESFNKEEQRG
ncbi:hypothetical protein Ahy_B04g069420 [Arachis hypogaea]|uniref:Protein kinase domain-containing protein n=1 Tax=Arachis hypogaea TaxID=3818 RepID=A0A444ZCN1_ARAHY|nr:hypothetical protein Ahy_B04g069420 [Arachis hypogaea]